MTDWLDEPARDRRFATIGEQVLGVELRKETRAGVEHYVPGQLSWRTEKADEATILEIAFVSGMGMAWLVMCAKNGDKWTPVYAVSSWLTHVRGIQAASEIELPDSVLKIVRETPFP